MGSMWEQIRDSQKQQNDYPLDVIIHHRIWDVSKDLLQALVELMEKLI